MKIDFKKYVDDNAVTREIKLMDGDVLVVKGHIPYESKVEMAKDIAAESLIVHDDSCIHMNYREEAIIMWAILKYYTDADLEGVSPEEAADFVIYANIYAAIMEVIGSDFTQTMKIYNTMIKGVVKTFDDDRSLTRAIRTSFGFLFTGEDVTESLAKAEAMKDTIYNAIGALRQKEQEDAARMQSGRALIGGNVISFAKKE